MDCASALGSSLPPGWVCPGLDISCPQLSSSLRNCSWHAHLRLLVAGGKVTPGRPRSCCGAAPHADLLARCRRKSRVCRLVGWSAPYPSGACVTPSHAFIGAFLFDSSTDPCYSTITPTRGDPRWIGGPGPLPSYLQAPQAIHLSMMRRDCASGLGPPPYRHRPSLGVGPVGLKPNFTPRSGPSHACRCSVLQNGSYNTDSSQAEVRTGRTMNEHIMPSRSNKDEDLRHEIPRRSHSMPCLRTN